jgi:hypothetical protein
MKLKFRKGIQDPQVFCNDTFSGLSFDTKKAQKDVIYYTSYGDDIYCAKLLDTTTVTIGIIPENES